MINSCLVVADDEVFRLLQSAFDSESVSLSQARTGSAGLRWIAERRAAVVVILDLPLADISGSEFVESLFADAEAATRVVLVCLAGPATTVPSRGVVVVRRPGMLEDIVGAVDDARRRFASSAASKAGSSVGLRTDWLSSTERLRSVR